MIPQQINFEPVLRLLFKVGLLFLMYCHPSNHSSPLETVDDVVLQFFVKQRVYCFLRPPLMRSVCRLRIVVKRHTVSIGGQYVTLPSPEIPDLAPVAKFLFSWNHVFQTVFSLLQQLSQA